MTKTMYQLQQDHGRMARILDILDRHITLAEQGETPDWDLLESILEYNLNYREREHHRREEGILVVLERQAPSIHASLDQMPLMHEQLNNLARRFAAAIRNARSDAELPLSWFASAGRAYVDSYREHMDYEEMTVYPQLSKHLTEADWEEAERITRPALKNALDPLAGPQVMEDFRPLNDALDGNALR
ncbi:MAG: hemerythrin domain-containing protein [Magnetovibrionaceae bacterium]